MNNRSKYFIAGLLIGFWLGLFMEQFVTYAQAQGIPGVNLPKKESSGGKPRAAYPGVTVPRTDDGRTDDTRGPIDYGATRGKPQQQQAREDEQAPQDNQRRRDTRQVRETDRDRAPYSRTPPMPGFEKVDEQYRKLGRQIVSDITAAFAGNHTSTLSLQQRVQMNQHIRDRALKDFQSTIPAIANMEPGEWMHWHIAQQQHVIVHGPRDSHGTVLEGTALKNEVRRIENDLDNLKKAIALRLKLKDEDLDKYDLGAFGLDYFRKQRTNYIKADKMADEALDVLRKKYGKL